MKKILFVLLAGTFLWGYGQSALRKHSLSSGGGSSASGGRYLVYAVGELGTMENTTSGTHISEGFIGPDQYQIILGVEDYQMLEGVEVYPNPAGAELYVRMPYAGRYEIRIYDLTGHEIARYDTRKELYRIDVSRLEPGAYLIGIIDRAGEKYAALKFIKRP